MFIVVVLACLILLASFIAICAMYMRLDAALREDMRPINVTIPVDLHVDQPSYENVTPLSADYNDSRLQLEEMAERFAQFDPMDGVIPYVDVDWNNPIDGPIEEQQALFNNLLDVGDEDV